MNEVLQEALIPQGKLYPANLTPPLETLALAKSLLTAQHAEESARRQRERLALARVEDRARHLALGHLRHDSDELKQLKHEYRELVQQRHRQCERGHGHENGDTAFDIVYGGSGLALAAPPYDFDWTGGGGPGIKEANRNAGNYYLRLQNLSSGWQSVAAGVGFWFYSGDGNPRQRFAALLDYNYAWDETAMFYVADNRAHTRLAVFGASEKAWVVRSEQAPSWSDHVGWLDSNSNADEGRVLDETWFNAAPRSWYQCWIWSQADAYADYGVFGASDSTVDLRVLVRYAVMGSL